MDMEIWYLKIKFVAQFAIDGFELLRAKKVLNMKYKKNFLFNYNMNFTILLKSSLTYSYHPSLFHDFLHKHLSDMVINASFTFEFCVNFNLYSQSLNLCHAKLVLKLHLYVDTIKNRKILF